MPKQNTEKIKTALEAFRKELPSPSRESVLNLLRVCGFRYRKSSERVDIYKSALLPDNPVTINRGIHLHEGMAKAIINVVEKLLSKILDSGDD